MRRSLRYTCLSSAGAVLTLAYCGVSIYALVAGLLMMLFGRLENSKTYNPPKMLVIGYGLFIVVAIAYMNAETIQHLYIAGVTLALAMGIMIPAAKRTFARAQKKAKRLGTGVFLMGETTY